MRGRTMQIPTIQGLRPTGSRVREALFNMMGDMHGLSMLDLFAGSGVMAIEAISRGASQVLSIENNHAACQAMKVIRESWPVSGWSIDSGALPQALPMDQRFDVIFADPPYAQNIAEQLPSWLAEKNIGYDVLIIEESSRVQVAWQGDFLPIKQRKYGESTLYFFEPKPVKQ